MKRIVTALLLCAVFVTNVHAAAWTKLQDNKHVKMMLDKQSITQSGKYQKAWVKVDYKALQTNLQYPEKSYNNAKLLWYFNCAEQKSATAQVYQLLNEEQIYSAAIDIKRARFLEPVPETEADIAMHYVCKKKADAEAKAEKKARAAEAAKNKPPTQPEPKKKDVKPAPPPPAPAPVAPALTEPEKPDDGDKAAEANKKGKESKGAPKPEDKKTDKKKSKADKKKASEKDTHSKTDKHAKKDKHGKKDKHSKKKKKTKKHGKGASEDEEHGADMGEDGEHDAEEGHDEADASDDDHDEATSKKKAKKKHKKKHQSKKHQDDAEKHAAPKKHKDTRWQYAGSKGPLFWGEMNTDYATCKTGRHQSPIDISKTMDATLKPLKTFQRFPVTELVNHGHTVQANFKPGNILVVDGVLYQMKSVTFHAPSENKIMGKSFPLEAQFVHSDPKGKLAVLSVMFDEGHESKALTKLWKQMPKRKGKPKKVTGKILAGDFLPREKAYYRFSGSLTTPPCQEGVVWVVMKTPMTASKQQISAYKKVIKHDNNRPIQDLNGRIIVE